MARFVKGDVVVVPFPFSDLTQSKRRLALVIAVLDGDELRLLLQPLDKLGNVDSDCLSNFEKLDQVQSAHPAFGFRDIGLRPTDLLRNLLLRELMLLSFRDEQFAETLVSLGEN